jgi:hypothetical protein
MSREAIKAAKARARRRAIPLPPTLLDPNQRYSLLEAFATLRVSEAAGYRLMKLGLLRTFREQGRTFVHGSELIRACRPNGGTR